MELHTVHEVAKRVGHNCLCVRAHTVKPALGRERKQAETKVGSRHNIQPVPRLVCQSGARAHPKTIHSTELQINRCQGQKDGEYKTEQPVRREALPGPGPPQQVLELPVLPTIGWTQQSGEENWVGMHSEAAQLVNPSLSDHQQGTVTLPVPLGCPLLPSYSARSSPSSRTRMDTGHARGQGSRAPKSPAAHSASPSPCLLPGYQE